jgi:hypothetical protein
MTSDMTWIDIASLVSSIATTMASVAVVVTAIIYYGQLRTMRKARELESLMVIMKYVDNLELRKARYLMLEHAQDLQPLLAAPFSPATREATDKRVRELSSGELTIHNVDLALNALNNVCYLIHSEYAPVDAAAFMKNSLLRAWQAFEPYIRHRRGRRDTIGEPSRYAADFEWVVVNKYKRDKLPDQALHPTADAQDADRAAAGER